MVPHGKTGRFIFRPKIGTDLNSGEARRGGGRSRRSSLPLGINFVNRITLPDGDISRVFRLPTKSVIPIYWTGTVQQHPNSVTGAGQKDSLGR